MVPVDDTNCRDVELGRVRVPRDREGQINGHACTGNGERIGCRTETKTRVRCDGRACIATRHGVGRVRHLQTLALGMQRHVQEGRVTLKKVDGDANVAEL